MKVLSLLTVVLVSNAAMAIEITPSENQPVCLQRVYTAEHMAKNPKQKLNELTIKLQEVTYTDQVNQSYKYNTAQVVGRGSHDGALYGNTAGCTFDREGNASCAIECDGGSFAIKKRTTWANFKVTPNYYFPLFEGVLEADIESPPASIQLLGDDKDNNLFRLEKVSVDKCDAVISQVVKMDGGC